MNCFICEETFLDVGVFVRHFKHLHGFTKTSRYNCSFPSCNQAFISSSVFKRHLKVHGLHNSNDEGAASTNNLFESFYDDSNLDIENDDLESSHSSHVFEPNPVEDESDDENESEVEIDPDLDAFETLENSFEHNVLDFVLSLEDKNNLNFKDVQYIIRRVQQKLLVPLRNILIRINTNANILNLSRVISVIQNSFRNFNTEHKLLKYLKEENLYKPAKKLCVENVLIRKKSNKRKRTKIIKPSYVIMPIKFHIKEFFQKDNYLKSYLDEIKKC